MLIKTIIAFYLLVAQCKIQHYRIREVTLQKGERIAGIEITTSAALFVSVNPLPPGWNLIIDNDPSWNAKFTGSLEAGAAALELPSLYKLDFCLRKDGSSNRALSIKGELIVTSDFEHERRIPLTMTNFENQKTH